MFAFVRESYEPVAPSTLEESRHKKRPSRKDGLRSAYSDCGCTFLSCVWNHPPSFADIGRFNTVLPAHSRKGLQGNTQGPARILVAFVNTSRAFDLISGRLSHDHPPFAEKRPKIKNAYLSPYLTRCFKARGKVGVSWTGVTFLLKNHIVFFHRPVKIKLIYLG